MNVRGQRGEIATATVVIIAVAAVILTPLMLKTGNPFDRSADPSNRRTAAAISGKDIVEITREVAKAEEPVTVRVDRSVEASKEVTDPKLTIGQKIGRFFAGLGTWAVIGVLFAIFVLGVSPAAMIAWSRHKLKSAFRNTVAAIREVDDETYSKLKPHLAARQDKRDKRLIDKVKAELH